MTVDRMCPSTLPANGMDAVLDIAESVFQYARRWAVNQAPTAADARIFDACASLLAAHSPRIARWAERDPFDTAVNTRTIRRGNETLTEPFDLPLTISASVVTLHRFARRYTNGRGTFTTAIVNNAARQLIELGISLDETEELDGTIWAADGDDGTYDNLTPEQRAQALATLTAQRS